MEFIPLSMESQTVQKTHLGLTISLLLALWRGKFIPSLEGEAEIYETA